MALTPIYYDSAAVGLNDGTTKTDAFTTAQAALTAVTAGTHMILMDKGSTEVISAAFTCASTLEHPVIWRKIDFVDDSYADTDATVNLSTTGGNDITMNFPHVLEGLRIASADDISFCRTANDVAVHRDVHLSCSGSNSDILMGLANADSYMQSIGGSIEFTHANGGQVRGEQLRFEGAEFKGNADASGIFRADNSSRSVTHILKGCKFTALTTPTIFDVSGSTNTRATLRLLGCSLPSGYSLTDGIFALDGQIAEEIASDIDGASNAKRYMQGRESYRGVASTSTATYWDGSDTHEDGDVRISQELIPNSVCNEAGPMQGYDVAAEFVSTGSTTIELECIENYTVAPTQNELWFDVFAITVANSTQMAVTSTRDIAGAAALAAGAGLANWTGEPASSRSHKISTAITVNEPCYLVVLLYFAKYEAGKELYVASNLSLS